MKTNTSPLSNSITRRRFLCRISASGLLLASPRAMAQENAITPLRKLAGGNPVIETAVATQFDKIYTPEHINILATHFDSVTLENCMKWQQMCPEEGIYRFEDIDRLIAFTELDVDVIPRALYWNPNAREDSTKINSYVNGCPPEIFEKQANTYREAMGAVMANIQHVDRVTFWGFTDGRSWLNNWPWKRVNHGLLFDREFKPKPAFHAVAEMLRKRGSTSQ